MKPINTDHEISQGRIQVDHNETKEILIKHPTLLVISLVLHCSDLADSDYCVNLTPNH